MVSKIAECSLKNVDGSQPEDGQCAMGVPQPSGSGAPELRSEGMELRGKNQTEIPLLTHCTATRRVSFHTHVHTLRKLSTHSHTLRLRCC